MDIVPPPDDLQTGAPHPADPPPTGAGSAQDPIVFPPDHITGAAPGDHPAPALPPADGAVTGSGSAQDPYVFPPDHITGAVHDAHHAPALPPGDGGGSPPDSTVVFPPDHITGTAHGAQPAPGDGGYPTDQGDRPEMATPAAREATHFHYVHGTDHDPGYNYQIRHQIADSSPSITPSSVMKLMIDNPDGIFPFTVVNHGNHFGNGLREGDILDLKNVRFPGDNGNFVRVEHVANDQFTFRTMSGHFDGKDNLISFRIYQQDGHIWLEQTGWAPNAGPVQSLIAPLGAIHGSWPQQAQNLRDAVQAHYGKH